MTAAITSAMTSAMTSAVERLRTAVTLRAGTRATKTPVVSGGPSLNSTRQDSC